MSWFYLFLKKPKIRAKLHVQQISDELRLFFFFFLSKFVFPFAFSLQGPQIKVVWSFQTFWSFHTQFCWGRIPFFTGRELVTEGLAWTSGQVPNWRAFRAKRQGET